MAATSPQLPTAPATSSPAAGALGLPSRGGALKNGSGVVAEPAGDDGLTVRLRVDTDLDRRAVIALRMPTCMFVGENHLKVFLKRHYRITHLSSDKVPWENLYTQYKSYCSFKNYPVATVHNIGQHLRRLGVTSIRGEGICGKFTFLGIKPIPASPWTHPPSPLPHPPSPLPHPASPLPHPPSPLPQFVLRYSPSPPHLASPLPRPQLFELLCRTQYIYESLPGVYSPSKG